MNGCRGKNPGPWWTLKFVFDVESRGEKPSRQWAKPVDWKTTSARSAEICSASVWSMLFTAQYNCHRIWFPASQFAKPKHPPPGQSMELRQDLVDLPEHWNYISHHGEPQHKVRSPKGPLFAQPGLEMKVLTSRKTTRTLIYTGINI